MLNYAKMLSPKIEHGQSTVEDILKGLNTIINFLMMTLISVYEVLLFKTILILLEPGPIKTLVRLNLISICDDLKKK